MADTAVRMAVAWLALSSLATAGRAQPAAEPTAKRAQASFAARPEPVLFLLPLTDEATRSELRDALLAQFALVDAELEFELESGTGESLAQRMSYAQQRAEARDTIAVFWIDAQSSARWLVHMMGRAEERVVVRPVDASGDRRSAAIEAVAVMTRESTRALLEGVPPEAALPEPPAPAAQRAAPPPKPPQARVRALRLAAAYAGSDTAKNLPFRHGVGLSADFVGFAPLYAGAAYVFTPSVRVDAAAQFELQPVPLMLRAGGRTRVGAFALDLELGLLVEFLRSSAADPQAGVEPRQAGTKTLVALAPRARAEFQPVPDMGLFATLGADILLNNFSYIVEEQVGDRFEPRNLLRGRDLRPVLTLGIAFYP